MVEKRKTGGKSNRKKSMLSAGLLLFFGLLLIGTFFHQAIDDALFRVKVEPVEPDSVIQEQTETILLEGKEVEVVKYLSFWRLPSGAVQDGFCFVVEEISTEYGRYYAVRRIGVEIAAEEEGSVLISAGLTGRERVVAASDGRLEDGMRVALKK